MIPRADIVAWRSQVFWKSDAQVEQDLILSRILVELFSEKFLTKNLAFRGGTALHKLHLAPASRYSEDLDFVQITAGPIGSVMDIIHKALDPFLGKPTSKRKQDSVVLFYRMASEIPPIVNLRLKIEINTREHFTVLGFEKRPFEVNSRWFFGKCELTTYDLNELLGTKLRALYQRRKGRASSIYGLRSPEVKQNLIELSKYFKDTLRPPALRLHEKSSDKIFFRK